jgi:hypothetical protein
MYFSVLGEIENIGQTKNIFGLTVKAASSIAFCNK